METTHEDNVASRQKLAVAARTGVFLAVLLAVQLIGLPNPVTGTIVNAIFIFVLLYSGLRHALILAFLSPFGGIVSGHLPAPMYPILPVIVCGNFALIGLYFIFSKHSMPLRLVFPALVKGVIIGVAGYVIVQILDIVATAKWLLMPVLGFQFFTAVAGLFVGERLFQSLLRGRGDSV
ncbi:MAG TPA: hypothetical protein PKN29_08185 [Candidatus Ozemobacteraceae bacterium]|nr:hypothetical protein [Candidatus Ozemobacteraceae bacterium]